jgi:hypothetical protein
MDFGLELFGSTGSFNLSSSSTSSSSSSASQSQRLRELLAASWRLGYRAVAVNVVTSTPLRAKDVNKVPHIPLHTQTQPPCVDLIATIAGGKGRILTKREHGKKRRRNENDRGGEEEEDRGGGTSSFSKLKDTLDHEGLSTFSSSSSSSSVSNPLKKRLHKDDDDEENDDKGEEVEEKEEVELKNKGTKDDLRSSPSIRDKSTQPPFVQLSRLTVTVIGGSREAYEAFNVKDPIVKSVLTSYDLIACQPSTPEAMIEAAKSGNVDIIDLDMAGGKAPFLLTQADVEAVLSKGVVFEIPYAPCIRDASCRRSVASNASALLRLCRGRGVVITSSARSTLEVRSPRDVTVLAALWGLKENKAQVAQGLVMSTRMAVKESGEGALQVLKHAEERLLRLKGGNGVFVHILPTGMLTSSSSTSTTTTTTISSVMRKNANQSQDEKNTNVAVVVSSSQANAVSLQKQQYNGGGSNEGGGGNGGVTFLSSLAARGISASKRGWAVSVPPSRVSMK